ncbi:MAG: enoyl-CoA hydratase/isomerase family protein, partial [Holophagales bacterium]|nr:enoyl-CoA hydratase/isomerase family protein [Holophagales bacterium]
MSDPVILFEQEGRVALLTINRPDKLNALNQQVRDEMLEHLGKIEGDDSIGVVVITGAGEKSFVAGADISEFEGRSPFDQREAMSFPRVFDVMATFPKPVIAMINGFCLGGGCEMAMSCDMRIASEKARLGQPEIKLGLIPGGGGTQRLPRLVGMGHAMRLILTGDMVGAEEARDIGLVDLVFPAEELREKTLELAGRMASMSPLTTRVGKEALRASERMSIEEGILYERDLFCL